MTRDELKTELNRLCEIALGNRTISQTIINGIAAIVSELEIETPKGKKRLNENQKTLLELKNKFPELYKDYNENHLPRLLNVSVNGNKKLKNIKNRKEHEEAIKELEKAGHDVSKIEYKTIQYIIWNLPSIYTCPKATNECIKACYSMKSERMYKLHEDDNGNLVTGSLEARYTNYVMSIKDSFIADMTYTIYRLMKTYKNKDVVNFRIHEAGDYYSFQYALAWNEIVENCYCFENLRFISYSKSIDFVVDTGLNKNKNFVLLPSLWCDTQSDMIDLSLSLGHVYTAANKDEISVLLENGFSKCPCVECGTCGMCQNTRDNIVVEIH